MSRFLYVTYIRTTQAKLWEALLKPEFTRQYWFGVHQDCTWSKGAPWKLVLEDGRVADAGEVLEIDPPRKLVLAWRHQLDPELTKEGFTRATFVLETLGDMVSLVVTHESDKPDAVIIDKVSGGWPAILSSLKSLLETGKPLARPSAFAKAS